jgi:hypothetical protein
VNLFHMEIFNLACNDGALLKMNGIECGFLIDEGLVNPACFPCLEAIASKGVIFGVFWLWVWGGRWGWECDT